VNKYLDWAKREYSLRERLVALVFAGIFFVLVLPYLLVRWSGSLDQALGLPRFTAGVLNPIVGIVLILGGGFLGLWSGQTQVTIGSGTPLPMMPTQRLIVKPPFTYCRNPMTLGTIVGYLGIGIWLGSFSTIAIVVLFGALLLLYVKFIEEKELEARFGPDYLAYKKKTPFLLPRVTKRPDH